MREIIASSLSSLHVPLSGKLSECLVSLQMTTTIVLPEQIALFLSVVPDNKTALSAAKPVSIGTHDPTASRERVCCRLLCCCCMLLLFLLLLLLLLLPLACLCNFTLVHSKPGLGTWSGKKHPFLYYIYKWNSRLKQILVI